MKMEIFKNKGSEFWDKFGLLIKVFIGLALLGLVLNVINQVKQTLHGTPEYVQFSVWALLGAGVLFIASFLGYMKGKKDGSLQMLGEQDILKGHLAEVQDLNKEMHQTLGESKKTNDELEHKIASLKNEIERKEAAFHNLKDEVKKVKSSEDRELLENKWEEIRESVGIAKEKAQSVSDVTMKKIKEFSDEFGERSKRLFEKTQELLKTKKIDAEIKRLNIFKKKENDKPKNGQ